MAEHLLLSLDSFSNLDGSARASQFVLSVFDFLLGTALTVGPVGFPVVEGLGQQVSVVNAVVLANLNSHLSHLGLGFV